MKVSRYMILNIIVALCSFGSITAGESKKFTIPSRKLTKKMVRLDVEKKVRFNQNGIISELHHRRDVQVRCKQIYNDGSVLFEGTSQLIVRGITVQDYDTDIHNELNNIVVESVCPTIHFQFLMAKNGAIIAQHLSQTIKNQTEIEKNPKFKELIQKIQQQTARKQEEIKRDLKEEIKKEYQKIQQEDPCFLPSNTADEFLPLFRGKPKRMLVQGKPFFLAKGSYVKWNVCSTTDKTILLKGKGAPDPVILDNDRGILYQKEKRQVTLDAKTGHLVSQKIVVIMDAEDFQERGEWSIKIVDKNAPLLPVNPPLLPVKPSLQPVKPSIQPVKPPIKPVRPPIRRVKPSLQPVVDPS